MFCFAIIGFLFFGAASGGALADDYHLKIESEGNSNFGGRSARIESSVPIDRLDLENLSIEQLKAEMEENPDLLLLDIREIQERVLLGTIPGSKNVPRGMLEFWADPASPYYRKYFAEDKRTVLFCAGGGRSVLATIALLDMGYTNVAHLEAGFGGWENAGEPVEDVSQTSKWIKRPDAT